METVYLDKKQISVLRMLKRLLLQYSVTDEIIRADYQSDLLKKVAVIDKAITRSEDLAKSSISSVTNQKTPFYADEIRALRHTVILLERASSLALGGQVDSALVSSSMPILVGA
jgi:hypothetical protein